MTAFDRAGPAPGTRQRNGGRLRFMGRHVGALRALLAFGVDEAAAKALIAGAKAAGLTDIEFRVPAGAASEAGQAVLLRRMRGGHVLAFRVEGATK